MINCLFSDVVVVCLLQSNDGCLRNQEVIVWLITVWSPWQPHVSMATTRDHVAQRVDFVRYKWFQLLCGLCILLDSFEEPDSDNFSVQHPRVWESMSIPFVSKHTESQGRCTELIFCLTVIVPSHLGRMLT